MGERSALRLTGCGEGPGRGTVPLVQRLVDLPWPLFCSVEVAWQRLAVIHVHLQVKIK